MEERKRRRPRPAFWVMLSLLATYLFGLPALFIYPAEQILFNPEAYKRTLAEQEVYDRFPLIIGETLTSGGNQLLGGLGDQLRGVMEQANYESALEQMFPEAWVRSQTERLIDQFFAYMNFQSPELNLVIDFRPVKANLTGDGAAQISTTIIEGLPDCTQDELIRFGLQALTGQLENIPLCRPPRELDGLVQPLVQTLLRGGGEALPAQMNLADLLGAPVAVTSAVTGGRVESAWERWFGMYRLSRQTGPWLPWLALLGLVSTAVLALRTTRGPLFWLGWALVLPGLSAVLIALLLGLWFSQIPPLVIGGALSAVPFIADAMGDVVGIVTSQFVNRVIITGLGVAAVGAVLILLWGWRKYRRQVQPGSL